MNRLTRRSFTSLTVAAVLTAGSAALTAAPSLAAPTTTTNEAVDSATFTWGFNGYAQKGIFGPWRWLSATGDASYLSGSISGGTQSEYVVAAIPATSMPVALDAGGQQKTPNAVKFTGGDGVIDRATGEASLSWAGSFTLNPYPPTFRAPDEIYADPQLRVAPDGSGQLSMQVTIGEGVDQNNQPTPRCRSADSTVATFKAGSLSAKSANGYRVSPDYQGVEVTVPDGSEQVRNCVTDGGATGWWGAWPAAFVTKMPTSTRPHIYSTGCGGMQDNKPALPFDVGFGASTASTSVTVDETSVSATGQTTVTVTGTGFDPALATGTRPPLAGRPSGTYIIFGKFLPVWKPSAGATGTARKVADQKWAVLAADMATVGGVAGGAVELKPDGSFTAQLTVDKAAADASAGDNGGLYGIYTYAGGGAVQARYETFTPITFESAPASATVTATAPASTPWGNKVTIPVSVTGSGAAATGTVTARAAGVSFTATLSNGAADLVFPRLPVGTRAVTITYSGDATYAAVSTSTDVTVVQAASTLTSAITNAPIKPAKRAQVAVTVRTPDGVAAPSGAVRVKKANKVIVTKTALTSGRVTLTLPKLPAGKHTLRIEYTGSPQVKAGALTITVTVTT